jgi:Flp pilus assembly protein TadD
MCGGVKRPVVIAAGVTALVVSILLAAIDIRRERTYQRLLTQGSAALASREYARAVEAFSGAITLRPESMLAHLRRGETYLEQGQFDDAGRDLLTATALDPTRPSR